MEVRKIADFDIALRVAVAADDVAAHGHAIAEMLWPAASRAVDVLRDDLAALYAADGRAVARALTADGRAAVEAKGLGGDLPTGLAEVYGACGKEADADSRVGDVKVDVPPPCALRDARLVELGAGVGLTGLTCASQVGAALLTDGDERSVALLEENVARNAAKLASGTCLVASLKWDDEADIGAALARLGRQGGHVDIVLGSDLVYFRHLAKPLWRTAKALLGPGGRFIYAHTRRCEMMEDKFLRASSAHGFVLADVRIVSADVNIYVFVRTQ